MKADFIMNNHEESKYSVDYIIEYVDCFIEDGKKFQ